MIVAIRVFEESEGEGYAPNPLLLATEDLVATTIKGGTWDIWETPTPLDDATKPEAAQYLGRHTGEADEVITKPGVFVDADVIVPKGVK